MKKIRKSYYSLLWSGLWGIILLEIPFFVKWIKLLSLNYKYDDEFLYVKKGVFKRFSTNLPLYKIENVTAKSNIIGNGTLHIFSQITGAEDVKLEYVLQANKEAISLLNAVEDCKETKNIRIVDTF